MRWVRSRFPTRGPAASARAAQRRKITTGSIPTPSHWNPTGTFGNAGRNAFYGPGINNFNFALYKNVRLVGESKYIQLRFEFYNIFNHTQFQGNGIISLTSAVVNGNGASSNFGAKIYF